MWFWVLHVVETGSSVSQTVTHVAQAEVLEGQTSESHANLRLCGASYLTSVRSLFLSPSLGA